MRIAFYEFYKFHHAMLAPLAQRFPGCIYASSLPDILKENPQIIVLAEGVYQNIPSDCITIQTRHSLASKNNTYHNCHTLADYICVTGQYEITEYLRRGVRPRKAFWPIGYPQTDAFFTGKVLSHVELGLDPHKKTLLYAPTYNPELNSINFFGEAFVETCRKVTDVNIIIKPHPAISFSGLSKMHYAKWHDWFSKMSSLHNVYYVADCAENVVPYMRLADVMLSDVSGALFLFLVLNRPIILYTNKNSTSPCYDESGNEWRLRQIGTSFETISGFTQALETALRNPIEKTDIRESVKRLLFEQTLDGKVTDRFVECVKML